MLLGSTGPYTGNDFGRIDQTSRQQTFLRIQAMKQNDRMPPIDWDIERVGIGWQTAYLLSHKNVSSSEAAAPLIRLRPNLQRSGFPKPRRIEEWLQHPDTP